MNYADSNAAIFSLFWPALKAQCQTVLGYVPKVYWPDQVETGEAPTDKLWLRASRKTIGEVLSGFNEGENQSIARYDVTAILYVQMFYPQSDSKSGTNFVALAQFIKDSLQGKNDPTNVLWTKRVNIDELSSEKSWFRKNVVCEFTYQEIKR